MKIMSNQRRNEALAVFALLAGAAACEGQAQVIIKPMKISHQVANEGLTLIDSSSPKFDSELAKFLKPDEIARIVKILPYALIIINNTGRRVHTFTVVYSYPDYVAPAGTPWRYRISPSASILDPDGMLAPGDRYLVTPASGLTGMVTASGARKLWPVFDEDLSKVIKDFDETRIANVEATIDFVAFEDGTYAGPDSSGKVSQINEKLKGLRSLADDLEGLSGEDLRKNLQLLAGLGATDIASEEKAGHAQHLLLVLDARGEPATLDAIKKLRKVRTIGDANGFRRKDNEARY